MLSSIFSISKSRLIYDEVLPAWVGVLGVLPSDDGKVEALLVGGENRVWKYTMTENTGGNSPPQ